MKKTLILTAALLAAATSLTAQNYVVNATVEGSTYVGQQAKLYDLSSQTTLDSAIVTKKGTFTFQGTVDQPQLAYISVKGKDLSSSSLNIILEPGDKKASTITADITHDMVKGTPLNNRLNDYYKVVSSRSRQKELEKYYTQYVEAKDDAARNRAEQLYDSVDNLDRQMLKEESLRAYSDNKDNVVGAYAMYVIASADGITLKEVEDLLSDAGKAVTSYKPILTIIDRLKRLEATAVGQHFTDFDCIDFETGEPTNLSNKINGRLALVDFWASWCRPCRHEIATNLIPLYEKYRDQLLILGVDVWDKPDKHREAVEQMGIKYPQIIDPTPNATNLYGIEGIPHIMLVAPDGTILARDLRGEQIEKAILQALGQ